jgi:radical SAM superfamily enzyme YgiQ (UPF0313 family)
MRILLISPKVGFSTEIKELNTFWNELNKLSPDSNLWFGVSSALLTVAALTPSDHNIEFIDENFNQIDFSKNYDLVGISLMTQQAIHGYKIADRFRNNNIKVVLGGVHVSLLPEEAINHADCIVIGEAEYVWKDILKDLENTNLKEIYKSNMVVDLKDSPVPRYDLLNISNYKFINVQTSRGCPHDCDYCTASKIFGFHYRNKNIKQVINEIEYIKTILKDPFIAFSDDNFLVNRKLSINLLEEIIPLKIRWHAQSDISIGADQDLLKLMKKSGCNFVFIGLESITKKGLTGLDKKGWKLTQLKNYSKYINNIQNQGIGVIGAFIIGLDEDELFDFQNISNFVKEHNLYGSSFTILTPYPGSRTMDKLRMENRINVFSWDKYTGYNVTFSPNKMSKEDLERGIISLYKSVYTKENYLNKMQYFKKIQNNLIKHGLK